MPSPTDTGVLVMPLVWAAAAGYLLGSLPFGYLVARANGVNIFEVGSKSSGATNVRRVVGTRAGGIVLGLDAVVNKSTVPVGSALLVERLLDRPGVAVVSNPATPTPARTSTCIPTGPDCRRATAASPSSSATSVSRSPWSATPSRAS